MFTIDMAADKSDQSGMEFNPRESVRRTQGYDPNSPETKERRRKLFEAISRNRTPETDAAMNKLASDFYARLNS